MTLFRPSEEASKWHLGSNLIYSSGNDCFRWCLSSTAAKICQGYNVVLVSKKSQSFPRKLGIWSWSVFKVCLLIISLISLTSICLKTISQPGFHFPKNITMFEVLQKWCRVHLWETWENLIKIFPENAGKCDLFWIWLWPLFIFTSKIQ